MSLKFTETNWLVALTSRPPVAILLFYLFVHISGAALAPTVFFWQQEILGLPFHKVAHRTTLLVALFSLLPFARILGLDWNTVGYAETTKGFVYKVAKGWLIGLAIMLTIVVTLLLLDVRYVKELALSAVAMIIVKSLISGLAIGLWEETLFRGVIFGSLLRSSKLVNAVVISALIYTVLHFTKSSLQIPAELVTHSSGFELFFNSLQPLANPVIIDSFIALFLAGVFLSIVRYKAATLAFGIGIHAGWVFVIKLTRKTTHLDQNSAWSFLVGSYDEVIGVLASVLLLFFMYLLIYRKKLAF